MASTPIKIASGWKVRWRHEGTWQQIVERFEKDADRLSDWLTDHMPRTFAAADIRTDKPYLVGHVVAAEMATKRRTFAVVYAEYSDTLIKAGRWSEAYTASQNAKMQNWFSAWLDRPVDEIGADDLNERWSAIRADMRETSAIGTIAPAKAVLTYAHDMGYTRYNPRSRKLSDSLAFTINPDTRSPRTAITRATYARLIGFAADDAAMLAVRTMGEIGARIGELCALRTGDVDLDAVNDDGEREPTITISGKMSGAVRDPWTKGERGRQRQVSHRGLPISVDLAEALRPLVEGRAYSAPLFAHTDARSARLKSDGHWYPSVWRASVWAPMVERARAAGVRLPEGFVPHSLRHSMATWLAAEIPAPELMERMRHTTIRMTMRYYHDNAEAKRRERTAVTKIFEGIGTTRKDVAA